MGFCFRNGGSNLLKMWSFPSFLFQVIAHFICYDQCKSFCLQIVEKITTKGSSINDGKYKFLTIKYTTSSPIVTFSFIMLEDFCHKIIYPNPPTKTLWTTLTLLVHQYQYLVSGLNLVKKVRWLFQVNFEVSNVFGGKLNL